MKNILRTRGHKSGLPFVRKRNRNFSKVMKITKNKYISPSPNTQRQIKNPHMLVTLISSIKIKESVKGTNSFI